MECNTVYCGVKVKVTFTLELATKDQRGPGARWGLMVNATPRPLYLPGKRPGTQGIGVWVDPRSGLDVYGKLRPHRDSISRPSSPHLCLDLFNSFCPI